MTASTAIVQMRADPAMRGRVLALQAIVFLGTTPVGGPLLGWCARRSARAPASWWAASAVPRVGLVRGAGAAHRGGNCGVAGAWPT